MRAHTLDIYGAELYLATTGREWATLRRRLSFLAKGTPQSAGLVSSGLWVPKAGISRNCVAIWINVAGHANEDPGELVDTCAHEAAHAASHILDTVGHQVAGDEPHAYLVGWLTRWIWDQVAG